MRLEVKGCHKEILELAEKLYQTSGGEDKYNSISRLSLRGILIHSLPKEVRDTNGYERFNMEDEINWTDPTGEG